MNKILSMLMGLFVFSSAAVAQNLPAGSLGTVTNNTANTWQTFTYTFTPSTSGANFLGFAFRQDPAFWTFDNVRMTVTGSNINLLANGTFDTGGSFSVSTNNGPSSMQAPTNWGVWYQNGTYPAAAGTWTDTGGTHGGVWYDGAVGSFDGIYQGVNLTASTSYTVSFDVSGNNTANTSSIQLGVYGGACSNVSIAASQCTIPSSVGFTTLATPEQGAAAGNPTPQPATVVSTAAGTPIVSSTTAVGTSTVTAVSTNGTTVNTFVATPGTTAYTSSYVDRANAGSTAITVTRATTVVGTTPFTRVDTYTTPVTTVTTTRVPRITTTTTTTVVVTTWSDGTTTSANGTPVVTTSTTYTSSDVTTVANRVTTATSNYNVVQSATGSQSSSASNASIKDFVAYQNNNLFTVNPLNTKNGAWVLPSAYRASANGTITGSNISFGGQKTIENNTFGIAGNYGAANSSHYLNAETKSESYAGTAYLLSRQLNYWGKVAVGVGRNQYTTNTSLPIFSLYNITKADQTNIYADLTLYSAKTYYGLRPFAGAVVNNSTVGSVKSTGSSLLSTDPSSKDTYVNPYAGLRYEFNDFASVESKVTYSKDYKAISSNRLVLEKPIFKNFYVNLNAGYDKGSNYQAVVGMVGLKATW